MIFPSASSTITFPAAVSQGLNWSSQNPSSRPQAMVAEVDGGGTGAAHSARSQGKHAKFFEVVVYYGLHIIGKACDQESFVEFWRSGEMIGCAVERGAFSLLA